MLNTDTVILEENQYGTYQNQRKHTNLKLTGLMRRTGRTTRIANYAIEQLLDCGNAIVADHAVFDGHGQDHLIDMIYQRWNTLYAHNVPWLQLRYREHKIQGSFKSIGALHFYFETESEDIV